MFLGGCPCCGKKDCWRCYGFDPCISAEGYYNLEAEFTLLEYFNEQTETGRNMDKTPETGLPVGTKILTTDGYDFDIPGSGPGWEDPESSVWSIYGYYSAPEAIECLTNLDGSVTISPKINPRVTFYKNDDVDFCNQMRAGIGFEYPPSQWSSAVKAQSLTYDDGPDKKCIGYSASGGPIKEFQLGIPYVFTSSVRDGSGNRQVSLRWEVVIRKKASTKTEAVESKKYQCFDAPPDEDGWTPVGKCHPDEESCAKECGPWQCYEKQLPVICPPTVQPEQCGQVVYPDSVSVRMNASNFQPLIRPQNAFDINDISGPEAEGVFGSLSFQFINDPEAAYPPYRVYANSDVQTGEAIRASQGNPPLYAGKLPIPNYGFLGCTDAPFPPIDFCDICTATYDSEDPDCKPYAEVDSQGSLAILCSSSRQIDPSDGVEKEKNVLFLGQINLSVFLSQSDSTMEIGGDKRYSMNLFKSNFDWEETPGYPFVIAESWGPFPEGVIKKTISIPFNMRGNPGVYDYRPNISCFVQQRMNRTCDEIINKPNGQDNQCIADAEFSMDGGLEVDVILTVGPEPTGTCCLPDGDCLITTHTECADQCGIWTAEANCEDNPCPPVDEARKQCFSASPGEDGWTPVGGTHATEELCNAACGTTTRSKTMPTTTTGPGTHLKNMLAAWGIHAKKGGGCKCRDMEVKMNRWGSDCRQHMDAIVDHLQAEAKKRKLPFVRRAGEMLVKRAIKRFEKES